jgi:hypothetical protein
MPPAAPAFVGIDVAKAELVIAIRPSGDRRTVANDEAGIQTLLEGLRQHAPALVSMGGVMARSIALRRPHTTRHVITLGSPLSMTRGRLPDGVRLTAVYSRSDPIVRYPHAVARDAAARNIEVRGSHSGLAGNPEVYRQLAHLLPGDGRNPGAGTSGPRQTRTGR